MKLLVKTKRPEEGKTENPKVRNAGRPKEVSIEKNQHFLSLSHLQAKMFCADAYFFFFTNLLYKPSKINREERINASLLIRSPY
jgi:hypothetical protein